MKKTLVISLSLLLVAILTMSFLFESTAPKEETTGTVIGKELAMNTNEDSIQVVDRSKVLEQELEKINEELNALEEMVEVVHESTIASYYHDKFNGRKTASGKIFSNKELTAAHKTLPFGTKVRVTNLKNDESVIVTITDRGPFVRGRSLDLSKKAFMDITHHRSSGTLNVKIEVLPDDYLEEYNDLYADSEELLLSIDSLNTHTLAL